MSTNFPVSSHTVSFVAFSRTMRNWWGNPCISHIMKYTIGWESDGKKAPILWKKYEYQFHRLSPYHGFCCIFAYCGKFMEKPMHFSYNEVYHRMGIEWEKSTHTMKKVWVSIPRLSPYYGFCCTFPYCGKLLRKRMHFPMLKYTIGRESDGKKASILWEKYEYQFPWLLPYHDFCCIFPYCGKFMGEPMHFPYDDIGYFFSVNSSNYILLPSCYF